MDGWQEIARAITDRMAERGMTQRELAERSGVSVASLRELQHGVRRRRSSVMLSAVSRALGLPDNHLRDLMRNTAHTDVPPLGQKSEVSELRDRVEALEHTVTLLGNRMTKVEKRSY